MNKVLFAHMDTMPSPAVCILLSTFNGQQFIGELLDSIFQQTIRDVFIVIRDDGSTDDTVTILLEYNHRNPGRIHIIEGTNVGPRDSFGLTIEWALKHHLSNYYMFADQDDVWLPTKVADTLEALRRLESGGSEACLVFTDSVVTDHNLVVIHSSLSSLHKARLTDLSLPVLALEENYVAGNTIGCNLTLLQLAAPIPPTAVMHDYWLGLVAYGLGKVDYLPQSTLLYRQHQSNAIGGIPKSIMTHGLRGVRTHFAMREQQTIAQLQEFLARYQYVLDNQGTDALKIYCNSRNSRYRAVRVMAMFSLMHKNVLRRSLYNVARAILA